MLHSKALMNATHAPELRSWVTSANAANADFPIQNLPFAVLRRAGRDERFRPAVAIGDYALDLRALHAAGLAASQALDACQEDTLNRLMGEGPAVWSALRADLSALLAAGSGHEAAMRNCLVPLREVEYRVPAYIGDYTDFYASIHHATNIGRLFRPHNPLLPNYRWVPIAYHGRSSSIVVSGQGIVRPCGQLKSPDREQPEVGPCRRLDHELEVGIFVGPGNALGHPVGIDDAEDHVFGLCLLNDWSARDIQAWEYQPLGPFLAKSFATTISPWIVTMEALAPFRAPWHRAAGEPQALPYLSGERNSVAGAIDMQLEVLLQTAAMRETDTAPESVSRSNFSDAYWTVAQMVAHHTVNGCNLQPGDLFGSGTMSGSHEGSQGALIEITRGGSDPIRLGNGEERTFLEDGDTVILRAHCDREGAARIGFGEAVGKVLPARPG
ncbi:MAG: fumarylacetoacetase [Gammaproteobacteria bacterium]|nr:fumarylacetoacetase [Gammaproteobacteria bacterium]